MNYINPYLQPGTYAEIENPQRIVVVTDLSNHPYNTQIQLHEFTTNVLVIYRPLIGNRDMHEVYATPLDIFNQKFLKV
jgi:hypothetical protein